MISGRNRPGGADGARDSSGWRFRAMSKANYADLPINHSEEPIRLFKSDFLEFFTHIHPVVVLLLYVPVVAVFLAHSYAESVSRGSLTPLWAGYAAGILVWTV